MRLTKNQKRGFKQDLIFDLCPICSGEITFVQGPGYKILRCNSDGYRHYYYSTVENKFSLIDLYGQQWGCGDYSLKVASKEFLDRLKNIDTINLMCEICSQYKAGGVCLNCTQSP